LINESVIQKENTPLKDNSNKHILGIFTMCDKLVKL